MISAVTTSVFLGNEENSLTHIWSGILSSAMENAENKNWFSATIGRTNLLRIDANEAVLSVPSELHCDFVEKDAALLIEMLRKTYPQVNTISFEVVITKEAETERELLKETAKEEKTLEISKPVVQKSAINGAFYEYYTFDSFVVCDTNRKAFNLSIAVAEMPEISPCKILAIYGKSGIGKTHLLQAIGQFAFREKTAKNVLYLCALDFVSQYVNWVKEKRDLTEFFQKFGEVDLFLIDDVHLFRGAASQRAFFDILTYLYDDNRQIVVTSDCAPGDIPDMFDALKMRLNNGIAAEILPPLQKDRMEIIKKKLCGEVQLSAEVLSYIAEISASNIRELEGLYNRVVAASVFCNADLDINSVKEILNDYMKDTRRITAEIISDKVCEYFGITTQEIRSSSRKKEISYPRSIAMYLMRTITGNSEQVVGNILGRDHSTVCITCKNIAENLKIDKKLETDINFITAAITGRK